MPSIRLRTSTSRTQALVAKDRAHLVHPYGSLDRKQQSTSLPIVSGQGTRLVDSEGRAYLDAVGGMWCTNIGTGNEEMVAAIADQVRTLSYSNPFVDMTTEPAVLLAERLASLAPGDLKRVFFTTGGSTAVDSAFRFAHFYQNCRGKPNKKHVLTRKEAFHGSTYASISLGGKAADRPKDFDVLTTRIHHLSSPNVYRPPPGMDGLSDAEFAGALIDEMVAKIRELGGAEYVAAFFAEPIMGSGGVIVPPPDYLKRAWEVCKDYDILFVADEVVTAFGRLGHWFVSQDMFQIHPDILVCAKGLTSGYLPLGAMLFSERMYEVVSEPGKGRYFAHGFTYSGHPVCCAAALKNIEILERDRILEHVRGVGPYFIEQLQTLNDLAIVGDVRGSHLMACIEFVQNKHTKGLFPESMDIGKVVSDEAEARGLIVRPVMHLNILSPPLVITRSEIDFVVHTLRQSIEAAERTLRRSATQ